MIKVYIEDAELIPAYAHITDAGMDVCAAKDMIIAPGQTKIVPTGLKMAIPEGFECQVRPRSGLSVNTPLRVVNTPGTIDAGYRGEVGIILQNTSRDYVIEDNMLKPMIDSPMHYYYTNEKGNKQGWYIINKGDRIAQLVFNKVERAEFEIVASVAAIGEDRGGGFGSTGVSAKEEE